MTNALIASFFNSNLVTSPGLKSRWPVKGHFEEAGH